MELHVTDLSFRDFRSYETFCLHDIGMLTAFVGPNGIGKTNVIEGIRLMTALTSLRHATGGQLVRKGASAATLAMSMTDGRGKLDVSVHIEEHARRYKLNGKARPAHEIKGLAPSVAFSPDDLDLAKGSMGIRRRALDLLGSQLNANYHLIVKDYEKVLRHKNKLLKEAASDVLLDSIDEMLVTCGAQLVCYRASLFNKFLPHFVENYERIADGRESLAATFTPSWEACSPSFEPHVESIERDDARTALGNALESRRAEELARRQALVGPHADDIRFTLDGFEASAYASQGQQRSIVLAYKLAEASLIEEVSGRRPVLLLDDVMSELDDARREALVDYVSSGIQTFITATSVSRLDESMRSAAHVVELPFSSSG